MKVLITNQVPADHLTPLDGLAEIVMGPVGGPMCNRKEVIEMAPGLDAIINQHELTVDRELLEAAPKLKIIANVATGTNNFDLEALNDAGVWGSNCPGVFAESAADHTIGLLLAVSRRIPEANDYCRSGKWAKDGFQPGPWDGVLLNGKTMGIIGFGQIGRAVAKRAEVFGMNIVFYDVSKAGDPRQHELGDLLRQSNVISLHVPLLPSTQHLINSETLSLLPPEAILLNLSRCPVVDEEALANSLQSGHVLGAGMDVAENEPELHPGLMGHPRVVFSPHVGGGTVESRKEARLICARNVAAALKGERPPNAVNKPKK